MSPSSLFFEKNNYRGHDAPEVYTLLHECSDCGLTQKLGQSLPGTNQCCVRCHNVLRRVHAKPITKSLAWSLSGLFFYFLTVSSPMLDINILGRARSGSVLTGPKNLDDQGDWILSAIIVFTTLVLPFIKIAGTIVVLGCLEFEVRLSWIAKLYAFIRHMRPWVMIEIYMLGFLVAYSRLLVIAHVQIALAVFGLVGLMICIIAMDVTSDAEAVWQAIRPRRIMPIHTPLSVLLSCETCEQVLDTPEGEVCPRCDEILYKRKYDSIARAWALGIAATVLYIPSNTVPIMQVMRLGKVTDYTIYGGIVELVRVGLWPLAILVFCASILIPVFKLLALSIMLIHTHLKSKSHLVALTRLYRVIEFIGRWSMVDVFVVSILVALVKFGWIAQITADWGSLYFAFVVILTIMAVRCFDPRLMWDAREGLAHHELTDSSPNHSVPA